MKRVDKHEHKWRYDHLQHKAFCKICGQGSSQTYYDRFPLKNATKGYRGKAGKRRSYSSRIGSIRFPKIKMPRIGI